MSFLTALLTILLVMDPIGNIPMFLNLLKHVDPNRRALVITRESLIAFIILALFLYGGENLLTSLGISQAALGVSGGIILFMISIKMVFPPEDHGGHKRDRQLQEPFIVPMAVPLIAGPSSLATVLLFANHYPDKRLLWLGALAVASVIVTIILLFSSQLLKVLGQRFLHAVERLMGMILATLAVQMLLSGIQSYFHQ